MLCPSFQLMVGVAFKSLEWRILLIRTPVHRRQALSAQSEGRDPNQTVVQRLVVGIATITSSGISPYFFRAHKKIFLDTWNFDRAEG